MIGKALLSFQSRGENTRPSIIPALSREIDRLNCGAKKERGESVVITEIIATRDTSCFATTRGSQRGGSFALQKFDRPLH